ncbi:MAG: hypothetical protein LBN10_05145 [Propionibacteriaceae bacterium]|jgi:hypothetical protein|nr:hypothetical protein [Propionibacteriaceae bacterium]
MSVDVFPLGEVLARIQYELFDWEDVPSEADAVDEVNMAITLSWGNAASTRIRWANPGWWDVEGLEFGGEPRRGLQLFDASKRWAFLIGETLEDVSFSRTPSSVDLVWAVNLGFSGGKHLVVALGELVDSVPSYMPDTLVVTSSESVARSYWPTNRDGRWTLGPAWGDV